MNRIEINDRELQALNKLGADEPVLQDEFDKREFRVFHMIIYASIGLAYALLLTSFAIFSTKYLLDVVMLSPGMVSVTMLASQLVDSFFDPVCAYLLRKSKPTRFGTMKPW
jgi:Na+/melibiose symporter-like transporter